MEHERRAFCGVRRTFMKTLIMSVLLIGGIAGASVYAAGAESAGTYVKDSVITTKVKAQLAAKHMSTLANIKVDTDANGIVWLSGKAPSNDARDLAEMITRNTEGVTSVHNDIVVTP
jgi:hyperosmotically inducible periplasmic protein